jgi:hypothetical protein
MMMLFRLLTWKRWKIHDLGTAMLYASIDGVIDGVLIVGALFWWYCS